MLGVPTSWVYEQSRRGIIPTATLGRYRRFREEAVVGMIERLEQGVARPGAKAWTCPGLVPEGVTGAR